MREFTISFKVDATNYRDAIRRLLEALGAELTDPDVIAQVAVEQGWWTVNLSGHPDLFPPTPPPPDLSNVVSPFGRPVSPQTRED